MDLRLWDAKGRPGAHSKRHRIAYGKCGGYGAGCRTPEQEMEEYPPNVFSPDNLEQTLDPACLSTTSPLQERTGPKAGGGPTQDRLPYDEQGDWSFQEE